MTGLDQRLPGMAVKKKYSITGKNVSSYQNGFELLIKDLTRWKKEGYPGGAPYCIPDQGQPSGRGSERVRLLRASAPRIPAVR